MTYDIVIRGGTIVDGSGAPRYQADIAIAGDRKTCIERLREVAALDFDRITFALLSGGRRRRLEQLATEVLPGLKP